MVLEDHHLLPYLGVGAVLISAIGILGALALSPWFSLLENPLSALGRSGRPSAPVFNGALIASGVLGTGFVCGLWRRSTSTIERSGIALFGIAAVALVAIGVFPTPHPYHYPASVGFYLALTLALFVYGIGDAIAGRAVIGLTMISLGVLHATAWGVWWVLADGQGIAGPEAIGAGVFAGWVCGMSWRRYRNPSRTSVKT